MFQGVGQVPDECVLGLRETDEPGLREPSGEVQLVVVDVLAEVAPARNHDRTQARCPTIHHCGRSGVADDGSRPSHRLLNLVVTKTCDPRRVARWCGGPGLDQAPCIGLMCVVPPVDPTTEPVERVVIRADHHEDEGGNGRECFIQYQRTAPMTTPLG